jgi:hypothetical protein
MAQRGRPKKITTTTEELIDETPDDKDLIRDGKKATSESEVQEYIQGLGISNLSVKVYRLEPGRTAYTFLGTCPMDMASEEYIQENWGAGAYHIRCFLDGVWKGSKLIKIGSAKIVPAEKKAEEITEAPPFNPGSDPVSLQVEMIREEARTNRELLLKIVENMSHGKSSTMELMEVMTMMKALQPDGGGASGGAKLFSEILPFVREIMKMAGGNVPEEDTGWKGIIKDVVGYLPDVMKQMKGASVPLQNPSPPGPMIADGKEPLILPPEKVKQIQFALMFLKGRCRVGADPLAFVDFAMNTLDMEQSLDVVQLLSREYEVIAMLDADLMSPVYRPWFEAFFNGLKDAISERNTPERGEGDGGDAPHDAGTGNNRGAN